MGWRDVFDKHRFQPRPGETRTAFLQRLAETGFPLLGYAEALRAPVWELCREVTALRAELDEVKRELAALKGA